MADDLRQRLKDYRRDIEYLRDEAQARVDGGEVGYKLSVWCYNFSLTKLGHRFPELFEQQSQEPPQY